MLCALILPAACEGHLRIKYEFGSHHYYYYYYAARCLRAAGGLIIINSYFDDRYMRFHNKNKYIRVACKINGKHFFLSKHGESINFFLFVVIS